MQNLAASGLVPQVETWTKGFLADLMRNAFATLLNAQAMIRALHSPALKKTHIENALKEVNELLKPENRALVLGKAPQEEISAAEEQNYQALVRELTKFSQTLQAQLNVQNPLLDRNTLNEIDNKLTAWISERQGEIQKSVAGLLDSVTHPVRGAISGTFQQTSEQLTQLISSLSKDAPTALMNLNNSLLGLLGSSYSSQDITKAKHLIEQALNNQDEFFKQGLAQGDRDLLIQLKGKLEDLAGNAEPNLTAEHKRLIHLASELSSKRILQLQGVAMQTLFNIRQAVLHPEKGLAPDVEKWFNAFVQSQVKQANENILSVRKHLQNLQNPDITHSEFNKAVKALKDFNEHPELYIGRAWNPNENQRLQYLLGNLNNNANQDLVNFIRTELAPQVEKLIAERQGPIFKTLDDVLDLASKTAKEKIVEIDSYVNSRADQSLSKTKQALTTLKKAIERNKNTDEAKQGAIVQLAYLIGHGQQVFNPKQQQNINANLIVNSLIASQGRLAQYGQVNGPTKQQILEEINAVSELIQNHIERQQGFLERTIDTAIEHAVQKGEAQVEELIDDLEHKVETRIGGMFDRFKRKTQNLLKPFGIDPFPEEQPAPAIEDPFENENPFAQPAANADNNPFRQQPQNVNNTNGSPVALIDKAIAYLQNLTAQFGSQVSSKALKWPCDILVSIFDKAHHEINQLEANEIDLAAKAAAQQSLMQARQILLQAQQAGSIDQFLQALNQAKVALKRFPVLINTFQLPSFLTDPANPNEGGLRSPQEQILVEQRNIVNTLENLRAPQVNPENRNWNLETERNKESFIESATYFTTYQLIQQICGTDHLRAIIDEQIKSELEPLIGRPEYNHEFERLRRQRGYYGELQDTYFEQILLTIHRLPQAERKARFHEMVKEYIDRRADISTFLKFFIKFTLPMMQSIIEFFTRRLSTGCVTYMRQQVHQARLETLRPLSAEPVKRMTSWLQTYLNLLKAYSKHETNALDRDTSLKILMDNPAYNHGYQGDDVYAQFTSLAIDEFLPPLSLTGWIDRWSGNISEWKSTNTFSASSNFMIGNYFTRPLKWILGTGVQVGLFTIFKIPLKCISWIGNGLMNFSLKKMLINTGIVKNILNSSKHSFYEETPFTHVIDKIICEQMETIWKAMQNATNIDEKPGPQFDQIKDKLQDLLKSLFRILETKGRTSPDELKAYFNNEKSFIEALKQSGFNLVLDDVIDSISRLIFVAYQAFFDENQMEKQFSQMFKLLDEALITPKQPMDEEERRERQVKYQETKEQIQYYRDNILRFAIDTAVQDKVSGFGKQIQNEMNTLLQEFKTEIITGKDIVDREGNTKHIDGFVKRVNSSIEIISQNLPNGNLIDPIEKQQLRAQEAQKVCKDIEDMVNVLNRSLHKVMKNEQLGAGTKEQITSVIRKLTSRLTQLNSAFAKFYKDHRELIENKKVVVPIEQIKLGLERICDYAARGSNSGFTQEYIAQMKTQYETLFKAGKDNLFKISDFNQNIIEFKQTVQSFDIPEMIHCIEHKQQQMHVFEQFTLRTGDSPSFLNELAAQKLEQLNQAANRNAFSNLAHAVVGQQSPFTRSYDRALTLIQRIPEEMVRTVLLEQLNRLKNAQNNQAVERAKESMERELANSKRATQQQIRAQTNRMQELKQEIINKGQILKDTAARANGDQNLGIHQEGRGLLYKIELELEHLKKEASSIHNLNVLNLHFSQIDPFIIFFKDYLYKQFKLRSEALMEIIIRNPIMFEGIIREAVHYFNETHGGDRRNIAPPPSYTN